MNAVKIAGFLMLAGFVVLAFGAGYLHRMLRDSGEINFHEDRDRL